VALVQCTASFSYQTSGGPRTVAVGELLDESDPAVVARRAFFSPTAAQQLVTAAELDPTAAAVLAADPAFTNTYAALENRRRGVIGGRFPFAHLDGITAAGGAVTTTIPGTTATNIPLANVRGVAGLNLSTADSITIPADMGGRYEISVMGRWDTGTVGGRSIAVKVNGATSAISFGDYGTAFRHNGSSEIDLLGGDVVTMQVYSDNATNLLASAANDVYLMLRKKQAVPLNPVLMGWTGTAPTGALPRDIAGTWLSIDSWASIQAGAPLAGSSFATWAAANPTLAADIAVPLIPNDVDSATWNTVLDEVAAGTHDAAYTGLGTALATYGPNTVYARPWWEWNLHVASVNATKFITAWNRAIPLIRAAFAAAAPTKVLYISWCFAGQNSDPTTYYPDTANVDIISADVYGHVWGTTTPTLSALLSIVRTDLRLLSKLGALKNKPVALSEWGSMAIKTQGVTDSQGRGDTPEYVSQILDWIEANQAVFAIYYDLGFATGQSLNDTPNSRAIFNARHATLRTGTTFTAN
jgi:hypothetical protein